MIHRYEKSSGAEASLFVSKTVIIFNCTSVGTPPEIQRFRIILEIYMKNDIGQDQDVEKNLSPFIFYWVCGKRAHGRQIITREYNVD